MVVLKNRPVGSAGLIENVKGAVPETEVVSDAAVPTTSSMNGGLMERPLGGAAVTAMVTTTVVEPKALVAVTVYRADGEADRGVP